MKYLLRMSGGGMIMPTMFFPLIDGSVLSESSSRLETRSAPFWSVEIGGAIFKKFVCLSENFNELVNALIKYHAQQISNKIFFN